MKDGEANSMLTGLSVGCRYISERTRGSATNSGLGLFIISSVGCRLAGIGSRHGGLTVDRVEQEQVRDARVQRNR